MNVIPSGVTKQVHFDKTASLTGRHARVYRHQPPPDGTRGQFAFDKALYVLWRLADPRQLASL
jgi:hypothetical protein